MKIITIHSDYIKFQPEKKAIKSAEEVPKEQTEIKECLVILTAVEKADEENKENKENMNLLVQKYIDNIKDIASQVKAKNIVLYPYAHLSSNLSSPDFAQETMKLAEEKLKSDESKFSVTRAPFGWYKSFELKCKGHPLSELSREIKISEGEAGKESQHAQSETKTGAQVESQALKEEKKLQSFWYIMDTDGKLHDIDKFNFSKYKKLEIFSKYETVKDRRVTEEPLHVKAMKKLELVDYEPASDPGNLRYYPKGRLIKSLLENYVTQRVIDYGGMEVETPLMYDMEHPTLKRYLNRFPARQYQIDSDKKSYFLRFAACFGQFLIAHDSTISYKDMPYRIYELTRYSFRREQKGELTGLRRLRAFTMPDVHCMCTDIKQAMDEFKVRFNLCQDVQKKIGLDKDEFELAVRVTKEFYDNNKEFVENLVKSFGKPALIEMWEERKFYFVLKYELNYVDSLHKASALSTDQIDVENGERYNIQYTTSSGEKKTPLILHCSPSGAIERVIYALLEKAMIQENPQLPLWLSPTQIRIIPVTENFNIYSTKILDMFSKENIRADIDDRPLHVGKKIREAEQEWIPYILVVGEKEEKSGKLTVRVRETKSQKEMNYEQLVDEINTKTKDMPFKTLSLPKFLSKRPIFVG